MPIFEYECRDCGRRMEFLERRAGRGKHACEQCKGSNLQKMPAGFSVGRGAPATICRTCPAGPSPGGLCPPGGCCGQT